jgi:hypothetical protein
MKCDRRMAPRRLVAKALHADMVVLSFREHSFWLKDGRLAAASRRRRARANAASRFIRKCGNGKDTVGTEPELPEGAGRMSPLRGLFEGNCFRCERRVDLAKHREQDGGFAISGRRFGHTAARLARVQDEHPACRQRDARCTVFLKDGQSPIIEANPDPRRAAFISPAVPETAPP